MDTTTMLLITTMVMALGAITFSALNLAFDRSHYRKSVRPFCNVYLLAENREIRLQIENAGMGPMRIRQILLLKNPADPVETGVSLKEALLELDCEAFAPPLEQYVLPTLCKLNLVRCAEGSGDLARLKSRLNGCGLYIEYADVYDKTYEKREALTF